LLDGGNYNLTTWDESLTQHTPTFFGLKDLICRQSNTEVAEWVRIIRNIHHSNPRFPRLVRSQQTWQGPLGLNNVNTPTAFIPNVGNFYLGGISRIYYVDEVVLDWVIDEKGTMYPKVDAPRGARLRPSDDYVSCGLIGSRPTLCDLRLTRFDMKASTFKESQDQFDKRNDKNYSDAAEYPLFVVQNQINNFFHRSNDLNQRGL
jgi:hypothetical protein